MRQRIIEKLTLGLHPEHLEVIDESHQHIGHAGSKPEGETHFRVRIKCQALAGKNAVDRHRAIYALLSAELKEGVHALAIEDLP
jgi:BolA protein